MIFIAAVLWSSSGFFAKSPMFEAWPESSRGMILAFYRALFAAIFLLFLVRKISWDWRLLVSASIFAAMNITYLSAMVVCEASLAIWLQYTSSVWVLVISYLFLGERPNRRELWAWILVFLGVAFVLLGQPTSTSNWGLVLGLLSGFFFAAIVVTLRWLRALDAAWIIFVNHFLTAVLLAPVVVMNSAMPQGGQWIMLSLFGILQLGLPYALFARGLKSVTSQEGSAISLLEPLLVPVWVLIAYGNRPDYEPPTGWTIIGGGLILAGLFMRYYLNRRVLESGKS